MAWQGDKPTPGRRRVASATKRKGDKVMRFLLVHRVDERQPDAYSPAPEVYAGVGRLMGEMTRAAVLLAAEGVLPSSTGAHVRVSGAKRTVIDGPFAEAKEVIGGFALLQVRSKEEAIEWAARFAEVIGDVEVEVRQVSEQSDVGGEAPPAQGA
jgi:hypothetical protein